MEVILGRTVYTTLEEIAHPRHTALLVIDMQNDWCADGGAAHRNGHDIGLIKGILPTLARLIAAAWQRGVPVVYTQHTQFPDGRSDSGAWLRFLKVRRRWVHEPGLYGSWGWQIAAELQPRPEDVVVLKHRNSGFVGTNLDLVLRSAGIQALVITGVATSGCVESTARDAMYYDYYTVIPRDCVASFTAEVQETALWLMEMRFDVVNARDVEEVWRSV
ncbi:MAG: cysteine hydrolase [Armatimonadetes bacterium]|nr:cysteine hydrolase [Armatimonadota bacterium]